MQTWITSTGGGLALACAVACSNAQPAAVGGSAMTAADRPIAGASAPIVPIAVAGQASPAPAIASAAPTAVAGTVASTAMAGSVAGQGSGGMRAAVGGMAGVAMASAGRSAPPSAGSSAPVVTRTGGAGGAAVPAAGAAGAATAGMVAGAAMSGETCKGKVSQGIIIGDSYINWASHTLPADLAQLAGETWRLYAEGGASMNAGGIATLIPEQLERAIADNPDIRLIVMDGGGNDVLISDAVKYPGSDACKEQGAGALGVCKQIVTDTLKTFSALQDRAAAAGVKDIVFFFYPEVPTGTIIGGANPNEIATYALPMWRSTCESAEKRLGGKLRCHFVDMVPVFKGHPDWFAPTDIHPNSSGSAAMAKAIWSKMKEDCVWQPETSGCCRP